jgi:hypothetical protein
MEKIEAMQEAIEFIQSIWMGAAEASWEGPASDFVGATIGGGITIEDVQTIVEAYKSGEWTPVQNIDGEIEDGRLIKVRIWR